MLRYALPMFLFFVALAIHPAVAAEKFIDIQEVKSKSGVTAWLSEDHSLPIIALEFSFKGAGAVHDPAEKQGLARLASNTMDEGADDLDSQAFQKTLADNSITLRFNASRDNFGGSLKTLTRKKDLAFELMRKAINAPRFDEEAVERMRAANMARVRSSLSDPDWMAARLINDIAFDSHPYAMNSGGTLKTLKNITTEDLKEFAATHFSRDNLVVAAAGDINAQELSAVLDNIFGTIPEKAPLAPVRDMDVQNGGVVALYEKDVPQAVIEIMHPGIGREDPDFYAYQVMNFIFGGSGFGSRLTAELREKRGLTYGVFSQIYLLDHLKGLSVSTSVDNKNAGAAIDLIRQEFGKMRDNKISAKELSEAQSYITGSMPLALSSTDAIAGMLLGLRLDDLPIDYLDTVKDKIMAVTQDDVLRVAKRVLKPDLLTIAIVGRPENVTPTRVFEALPNAE